MSININSESWCRKAYLNYERYGNSMNLTTQEYYEIRQVWSHKLASWDAAVANDENEYDFEDSDYTNYKKEGAEEAEKDNGDPNMSKGRAVSHTSLALGIGGAGSGLIACISTLIGMGKKWTTGFMIAATAVAAAIPIIYAATKPNKEAKETCNALQDDMEGAQAQLVDEQAHMEEAAENTCALSDEANERNEEGNDEIAKKKAEYDLFMAQYLAIKAKIDSGEELTDSEKQLYKSLVGVLSEIGVEIDDLSETTGDEVEDLYDEIGEWQEIYDVTAESMGQIEGLTDYAESIDERTKTNCNAAGGLLTMNAAAAGVISLKLFADGNPFTKVVSTIQALMAAGGAAWSGLLAKDQFDWASQVKVEIGMREDTQDLNSETMGIYEEEIDGFDATLQGVEELELDIPEDVSAPEETTVPAGNNGEEDKPKPKPEPEKE